ncbi:MAG TPA: 2-hydroxychromene-2-carboxylate isomerase [Burkholderiales bacterium]|nr:2-hydroxychromene-2-carboxylate isomerase [Burkholderiales bacterium]
MVAPIDFYFDFSSPYGYIAATRIEALATAHGRTVVWHPILLGAIFKLTGQHALPSIPLKGQYFNRDTLRSARWFGVPFRMPSRFPIAGTAASRACYWIADHVSEQYKRLALALYEAYFVEDRDISETEIVLEVAAGLGVARGELAAALGETAVKERLKREVDEAIRRGVFGSPFVIVDGEPFWGSDRLDQVDRWLATGGW